MRGLKLHYTARYQVIATSHPVWGAWIEIGDVRYYVKGGEGRTPCGVRGLKLYANYDEHAELCRTPCGVRGLKCLRAQGIDSEYKSHPVWGAWIEIKHLCARRTSKPSRTPCGVRGLKLSVLPYVKNDVDVAPRVGCVD